MKTSKNLWAPLLLGLFMLLVLSACATPTAAVSKLICPLNPELTPELYCKPWDNGLTYDVTKEHVVDMYNNPVDTMGIYKQAKVEAGKPFAWTYVVISTVGLYPRAC